MALSIRTSAGCCLVGAGILGLSVPALPARAEQLTFTLLASFAGTNGADPWAPLTQGSDGNFYGTTFEGGANTNNGSFVGNGYGTVFRVTPEGVLSCLTSFQGSNGINPTAALG